MRSIGNPVGCLVGHGARIKIDLVNNLKKGLAGEEAVRISSVLAHWSEGGGSNIHCERVRPRGDKAWVFPHAEYIGFGRN